MAMGPFTVAGLLSACWLLLAATHAAGEETGLVSDPPENPGDRNGTRPSTTLPARPRPSTTSRFRTTRPRVTQEPQQEVCEFPVEPRIPFAWEPRCGTPGFNVPGCYADGIHQQCMFCGEAPYHACPTCEFRSAPSVRYYWDPSCLTGHSLGCKADGVHKECRFCGSGSYSSIECPEHAEEGDGPGKNEPGKGGRPSTSRSYVYDLPPSDDANMTAVTTAAPDTTTPRTREVSSLGRRVLPPAATALVSALAVALL